MDSKHTVYWPGMNCDLQRYRLMHLINEIYAPSQSPETIIIKPLADYPFQKTAVDQLQLDGRLYIVYADRLTRWLEAAHVTSCTSSWHLICQLRSCFTCWGAPEDISVGDGTNLGSKMTAFLFFIESGR